VLLCALRIAITFRKGWDGHKVLITTTGSEQGSRDSVGLLGKIEDIQKLAGQTNGGKRVLEQ
jgi:hypothetical protein